MYAKKFGKAYTHLGAAGVRNSRNRRVLSNHNLKILWNKYSLLLKSKNNQKLGFDLKV